MWPNGTFWQCVKLSNFKIGVLSAVVAQILWGLFPIYWKWLSHVTPLEVLSHRNLWCAVFLLLVILLSAERRRVVALVLTNRFEILRHLFSATLVASNWLVYIWAVVNDHVVDASLGYFLSPLVSVALGYFVFAEKLNARQWGAIALAVFGVLIGPINGLFIETLLLVPVTLMAFLWIEQVQGLHYSNPFGNTELRLYYREPIRMTTWAGFICIWLALFIYSLSIRKKPVQSEAV